MPASKLVNGASFVLLAGYVFALAFGMPIERGFSDAGLGDFALNLHQSEDVRSRYGYRALGEESEGFLYPPPYVVWKLVFSTLGLSASGLLWALASALAVLGSLVLSLSLLDLRADPSRWTMALLALVSIGYFVEWDLKAVNCNSVYLFLVLSFLWLLERGHSAAAGALLATSVALKLYSVFFLPYLLLKKEYRALGAAVAATLFFFAVVPGLYFSYPGALEIGQSWVRAIASHSSADAPLYIPAYIVSLQRALLGLLHGPEGTGLSPATVLRLAQILQAVWLGLVAVSLATTVRSNARPGTRRLVEGAVLMLLPLPWSPMVQPHHGVVALPTALVVTHAAFQARGGRRAFFASVLAATYLLLQFGPTGPLRGLGIHLVFAILMTALTSAMHISVSKRRGGETRGGGE